MCKAKELVNRILSDYNEIENEYSRLNKELSKCDLMQQDILHMIENDNFNAAEGYFYAKKLKDIREQRRVIKNELDAIHSINACFKNIKFKQNISEIHKKVEKIEKEQPKRTYTPRVLEVI